MKRQNIRLAIAAVGSVFAVSALAAVNTDDAKQLGASLTPWGAEKAGNKAGSIPEWTGGPKAPANYDPNQPGVRPDPYANEKPLYSVTPQNMDKYANVLSEGVKAMFKKYPTWRMDVYPSHRTAGFPKYINENSVKNATQCKAVNNESQLEGCWGGVVFPIPQTGKQVMWDHLTRYMPAAYRGNYRTYVVDASGRAVLEGEIDTTYAQPIFDSKRTTPIGPTENYYLYHGDQNGPARTAGQKWLFTLSIDQLNVGQKVYQYVPGQRRVKLMPDIAYDTPNPTLGGVGTIDEAQLFIGNLDRYDFKLIGKQELLIPYNTFKLYDPTQCRDVTVLTPHHVNPDCLRWELHRVWIVNATLKPGFRHIYPKRTFYFDEDWTGAGVTENYDAAGLVYRVGVLPFMPWYDSQVNWGLGGFTFDVRSGSWSYQGDATETGGFYLAKPKNLTFFSPESMAGEGIR